MRFWKNFDATGRKGPKIVVNFQLHSSENRTVTAKTAG